MAAKKAKPIVPAVVNKREKSASEKLDDLGIDAFCELILEGRSCRGIAQMLGISLGSMNHWLGSDLDRSARCAKAREEASQTYDEIALEILEQAGDNFALAKAKEIAHHYRWRAKAVSPGRYGDKSQTTLTGANGGPLDVSLKVSFVTPG